MKFERWTSRGPEIEPIFTSMTGEWSTPCLHFDDEEGEQLALIIGYTSIEGCIRARTCEHIDRGVPRGMETIAETVLRASG